MRAACLVHVLALLNNNNNNSSSAVAIDCPAGAAQGDAALLVVEGAVGGFEAGFDPGTPGMDGTGGGQTREHAQLARSLGLEQPSNSGHKA